jgi:hypothetical protein
MKNYFRTSSKQQRLENTVLQFRLYQVAMHVARAFVYGHVAGLGTLQPIFGF